ncbi:DNA polymerase delta subunit 3 isoform X2 [Tiliqua scincoides]
MKSKLLTVASVHIYSIQKAMLKDSGPLYNTDYDIIKVNFQNCSKFSAIHCADAVARTAAEMSRVEAPVQVDAQPPNGMNAVTVPVVNGRTSSTSTKHTAQQTKGIMGMFAAKSRETHKETKVETKEMPSVASAASSKAPAKGNVLDNFFGKAAMVSSDEVSVEPEQQKEEKSGAKSPVEPKSPSGTAGLEKPGKKVEPAKVLQKDKKRAKRAEVSDDEARESENMKKKKRRIKLPQSDSSEEEDTLASPVTPEVKDLSPEPPLKPHSDPVPLEAPAGGKKRKRKRVLKSRTFVDEEGCMVTEKVYESESCTDSEDDFRSKPSAVHRPSAGVAKKEPKEERKGARKGVTVPSKANKQASIMGFFQKK